MKPLDRKLLRDLGHIKGQIFTLALVVAGGVSTYVGLRGTLASVQTARDAYYDRERMGDVFATLVRAPLPVADRLAALPGVALAYPRLVEDVRLPLGGQALAAVGKIVSLPDRGEPPLNGVHLRAGRMPVDGSDDEVVVLDAFAEARGLAPGGTLPVVIEGRQRTLRVVGIGLSPEYVFAVRPGALSAEKDRYAILWMRRGALGAAFHREGAFDDVVLRLAPGASLPRVLDEVDRVLAPYGGRAAVGRDKQLSNHVLEGEFAQLEQLATMITTIFLAVAAFVVNVVLSRLVALQRPEIAALKALGYRNRELARHYVAIAAVTVALGSAMGVGLGAWYGRWMTALYAGFFHFPSLSYRIDGGTVAVALLVSLLAGGSGALLSLRATLGLRPAEAMQPPAPLVYRRTLADRLGLDRLLGPAPTMVLRELERRPGRTLLSALAIGTAVGIIIVGRFSFDSLNVLLDDLYLGQQREDATVTFARPLPADAVSDIGRLPGALAAEGIRYAAARLHHDAASDEALLVGLHPGARLRRLVDLQGRTVALPLAGVLLTRQLAERQSLAPGDQVRVELREGRRREHRLPVAGVIDEPFGLQAYLPAAALADLLGEAPTVTAVQVQLDPHARAAFFAAIQRAPLVVSVDDKAAAVAGLRAQTGESVGIITGVVTALAIALAVGVVYNNARVALSQRGRELATLRVLGFTRAEISSILLGELGAQILLGLPIGLALGRWWAGAVAATADRQYVRFPVAVASSTLLLAMAVAVAAGLASGLVVRRRLDRLDLPAVLKSRE